MPDLVNLSYLFAAGLFIVGLKLLSRIRTARRGNLISALGMLIAVIAALTSQGIDIPYIVAGVLVGTILGTVLARAVKMTAMPEMVALFNGLGGLASLLLGASELLRDPAGMPPGTTAAVMLAVLIGGVAFTGSLVALGKLGEWISGRPWIFPGQLVLSGLILIAALASAAYVVAGAEHQLLVFAISIGLALLLGIVAVIRIGGADMPIVIALLNSYSGVAAAMAGFAVGNTLLIVAGALVGASGLILTNIMCKAMNRSLANVLFGGFGATIQARRGEVDGEVRPMSVEDAYYVLEAAGSVLFVPGYGMAVAQAQHAVRELADLLEANGAEVRYAIHPLAGRMPGHMNVLLAEANVSYDQLVEPEDVNPIMETTDVVVVIGANDVVNPDARDEPGSPLYGMQVVDVDRARTVFVLKRSMNPGFAGVDNALFYKANTRMIFGDAKATISGLVSEFKDAAATA